MGCNRLVVLLASVIAIASAAAPEEPQLAGRWKDADRSWILEFARGSDGAWTGARVAAAPPSSRTVIFENLVYDARAKLFRGTLIQPEDGSRHEVTLTLLTPTTAEAVVRKLFFTKRLSLARPPGPAETDKP